MRLRNSGRPIEGLLLFLLVLGFSTVLWGQAVNGTLLGTVTDATGASISGAKVTARNVATNEIRESTTNERGNYTFPGLQAGPYSVAVEAARFKTATQTNIDLLINSTTRVDLVLVPGNVSETVLVSAAPPVLQTDRADINTKIESENVTDMPLTTNRNFQSLLNLVPGTAPATFQHSQFFNAQSSIQTQVNGLPREGNLYQIEGIDDDERTGLLQILIPPAEAIQTVDISTNNYEAELGRATGAITNVTLKSGSNVFHGSAFEFIQNSAVNARSYFSTIPLGHLSYNYFGGAVGGPILKDKLFFFGDYLHTTDHERIQSNFTIPDERYFTPNANGYIDLSAALTGSGTTGEIFDPSTGDGTAAHPRMPFKYNNLLNQIPFNRVNPVSLAILQGVNAAAAKYGTFNGVKPLSAPTNNYSTNLPFTKTTNSFDTKVDYALNESNHLSGRFSLQHVTTFQQAAFGAFFGGPAGGGFEGTGEQTAYSTGLNYDHLFSQSFFTEVRFGVAHLRNTSNPNDYGSNDATTLGIPGANIAGQPLTSGQVAITINDGISNPLMGYSVSEPWIRGEANIDFVNNWTKIFGNHTIKFGGDLRRVRDDLLQASNASGGVTFSAAQTGDASNANKTNVANDIASFLLDQPSSVYRGLETYFPCYRQWWFFAFASDKWQLTPKLTADLGLRWELYPPATPRKPGGFSNYNPENNTLVIAGIGGNPMNLGMKTRYTNFAPRVGIAYRLTGSTVLRGGFGISYAPFADSAYAYNYPISANNNYGPVGNSPYTPAVLADNVTVATFQAGFPAPVPVTIPANGIIAANTPALLASSYNYFNLNFKNPYASSWNAAVQQALPANLSLQVAYVANHGTDISGNQNINLPSTYGGGAASDPENIAFGRTAGTTEFFLGFSSNYESLQAQLTKRQSHGLSFTSAFTWGKGLGYISDDDGGLMFFINWRRNYAPNDYDRTFNFEQNFTYELPFGHGHAHLRSGLASLLVGGWKLSGIISAVSGQPFTVSAASSSLNTPGTGQSATLTGQFKKLGGIGSSKLWFDTSVFSQPAGCPSTNPPTPCTAANVVLGNTGRNQFRGPGYIQDNFSLFKKFHIYRESALEARIDAFQLSNTPQFYNPNGNFTSGSFGKVTSTVGSGQGSVNGVGGGRVLQGALKLTF